MTTDPYPCMISRSVMALLHRVSELTTSDLLIGCRKPVVAMIGFKSEITKFIETELKGMSPVFEIMVFASVEKFLEYHGRSPMIIAIEGISGMTFWEMIFYMFQEYLCHRVAHGLPPLIVVIDKQNKIPELMTDTKKYQFTRGGF